MVSLSKMLQSNLTDSENLLEASYLLSHRISKSHTPFTMGKKLVMPSVVDVCCEVLGQMKVSEIPLSNDTVLHRIQDMAADIESQVLDRARTLGWFAI